MANEALDYSTDTHLAKKYNDILYDCMLRCNTSGYVTNSSPHYENLLTYYGAINVLYINTFMLFEQINHNQKEPDGKFLAVSQKLKDWSDDIEADIQLMKTTPQFQKVQYFLQTFEKCKNVHKLIMYGLQKRNMLVRMTQKEPSGEQSINYWETKTAFKKGALKGDAEMRDHHQKAWPKGGGWQ